MACPSVDVPAPNELGSSAFGAKTTHRTTRASAVRMTAAAIAPTVRTISKSMSPMSKPLTLGHTFVARYMAATACKMYEVEELVDYYFHRRLAAVTAVVISALPMAITPNQITLFGLVFGWGAAACVYDSEFHTPFNWDPRTSLAVGAVLMFCWIVSDCADGQVARLCKRGTRTGRLLDGLVDIFVMVANCVVLGLVVWHRLGQEYAVLAAIAGVSLWLHCITYDKIKNTYMENALPQSECDGESVESVMAEYKEAYTKHPFSLDTVLFAIYVMYLTAQAIVTSDVASMKEHQPSKQQDEQARRVYKHKFAHVVRYASWMGLSAHVTGLYVGYFCAIFNFMALYYTMIYFAVVLNVVLVVTWVAYIMSGMGSASAASMVAP